MVADRPTDIRANLYVANTSAAFWQLLVEPGISSAEWADAVQLAASILPREDRLAGVDNDDLISAVLSEKIFGPQHWQLGWAKRLYYQLKPLLPRHVGILLRQRYRQQQETQFALGWPTEDRYVRFQFNCAANVLHRRGLDTAPYVNFWPNGHRFAFALTHDVESEQGHAFVENVANLEESLGFRSVFNFVPERYPVDRGLLSALKQRGFEVGVHGLKHDGKLFFSEHIFRRRATKINQYLREWGAVGFRSPYMHRNPEWLQALKVEYDLSFFDTDPYEPMPGGTMSIWPFMLGSFVELPYTLVQDHTLMVILHAGSPRLWLDKVDFVEQWHGLVLVNVHPDYLLKREHLTIYKDFLSAMKERENCWHDLPRNMASWWKQRAQFQVQCRDEQWDLSGLPGATISHFPEREGAPIAREMHR